MRGMRRLIAGNWKMYGLRAALSEIDGVIEGLARAPAPDLGVLICPPATLIAAGAARAAGTALAIGGQDCHPAAEGAHTGDIAAAMLRDAGASAVIVGHSERRADHAETDALVRAKAEAALAAGLLPILCVGETASERAAGSAVAVVERQLAGSLPSGCGPRDIVIAYEPVWAIGTGRVPRAEEIVDMHRAIAAFTGARLGAMGTLILYGGSVKPENAPAILGLPGVDGALVGGASLKAQSFLAILAAGRNVIQNSPIS